MQKIEKDPLKLSPFFCIIFLSFVLIGCKKVAHVHARSVRECEARLSDVPVPLDARPITHHISETVYGYDSALLIPALEHFYVREMERFGWRLLAQNKASGTLLVFQKPFKICTVALRRSCSRTRVRIDTMPALVHAD